MATEAEVEPKPDLWQRAIDSLSPSTIKHLEPTKTGKRDVALAALKSVEEKRQLSLKKRWKIKTPGKGEIVVRDVLEKIIHWIRRFRQIGDQIVQYDPGHAALPWAAFRFLLQVAVNDTTVYAEMLEDLEMGARLMARLQEIEKVYLAGTFALKSQLCDTLVRLYATLLEFLANAVKFFSDSTAIRLLKAPWRSLDEDYKGRLLAYEAEVFRLATIIDADRLVNLEKQVLRLADSSLIAQKAVQEQEYLDVLTWLSQVPYSRHHASHRETRVPGTGEWLIRHPEVRSWMAASSSSMLLLHGIPGSGKSVLCSAVIDDYLEAMSRTKNLAPQAYFYCNASHSEPERKTPEGVLRSLTRQLTVSRTPHLAIHSAVLALHGKTLDAAKADGFQMTRAKVSDCVDLILAAIDENPAMIYIDGLDEVDDPRRLVHALETIADRSSNVVKVFITSRENPAIFAMLHSATRIRITNDQNGADVRLFAVHAVTKAISDHKLLMGKVTQALKEQLIDCLTMGAGEMFLWVKLQLLHLCSMDHEKDLILESSSPSMSTLDELYQAAYERIQSQGKVAREIATRSFSWLLYAREPLTANSFSTAIVSATELGKVTVENILAICRGFLHFDKQSKILRLAHHSVQEFLQLQEMFGPGHGQNLLAISCISICQDPPDIGRTSIAPTENAYDYAVVYCGYHCSAAQSFDGSDTLARQVTDFLFDGDEPSITGRIWMDNCRVAYDSLPRDHPQKGVMELVSSKRHSILFPICTFGLLETLKTATWPDDCDWNQRNDHGHTALYAASFCGYTEAVAFLLKQGVNSDVRCGRLGSALHCAANRGFTEVVKCLLDHGADTTFGEKFDSAIHAACYGDQEEVVIAILEKSDIMNRARYDSALDAVSEAGFSRAIKVLQNHPLSDNSKPSKTLQMARKIIASGNVASLKYLTRGSSLAQSVPTGSVALSALHGHEAMTAYLLDQGLDIEEVGESGTPLRCASLNGSSRVCHLLLQRGADINGNKRFGSALHAAAMKGQLHIARLLLDAGADANIKGGHYGTPIQAAAYVGHKEVVSLLLREGADPHKPGISKDAFHAAAEGGYHGVIQLFLAAGFTLSQPFKGPEFCSVKDPDSDPPQDLLEETYFERRRQLRLQLYRSGETCFSIENQIEDDKMIDPSDPLPHAQAYVPVYTNLYSLEKEIDNSNYLLESAVAFGNPETVSEIVAQQNYLRLEDDSKHGAFLAACRNGNEALAEALLSQMRIDEKPLEEALEIAASQADLSMACMLLAHPYIADGRSTNFKDALILSISNNRQAFHTILKAAEKGPQSQKVREILLECLVAPARANREEIPQAVSSYAATADRKEPRNVEQRIRIAVESGCEKFFPQCLSVCATSKEARCFSHTILIAAGCGHLHILEILLQRYFVDDVRLLQQALCVAAENGQKEACAYLLSKGADPCQRAPRVDWGDVLVDGGLHPNGSCLKTCKNVGEPSVSNCDVHSEIAVKMGTTDEAIRAIVEAMEEATITYEKKGIDVNEASAVDEGQNINKVDLSMEFKHRPLNAVESCIAGFRRFECPIPKASAVTHSWPRKASEEAQASTLRLLLSFLSSMKDHVWDEAVCAAVWLCPPHTVEAMLKKGANAKARQGRRDALEISAGRECLSFPVMWALIERTGIADISQKELRRLLATANSHFCEQEGRMNCGALFSKSKSLEDVFTTGPGAVIEYLLPFITGKDVACAQNSVLLQCTAVAGRANLMTLLLDKQANINKKGPYYGTALHAASHFGHEAIVKQLLDAEADPDIFHGYCGTALGAAVESKSLELVNLLLQAGADTELTQDRSRRTCQTVFSTPLQLAIKHHEQEIAKVLIAAGAEVNVQTTRFEPLLIQSCNWGDQSLIRALLEAGADVRAKGFKIFFLPADRRFGSGVHAAIDSGRTDIIKMLVSEGFCLSDNFGKYGAPLEFAASKGDVAVINEILRLDSLVSKETMLQSLKEAIEASNFEAFERLFRYDRTLLDQGDGIFSLLRDACNKDNAKIVELLLESLSLRHQVQAACTGLLYDPPKGNAAVFKIILEYVPCTVNFFVEACARGFEEVVMTGLQQRMSPNSIDSRGRSAVHVAAAQGSAAVVRLLLDFGAELNAESPAYGTPLRSALEGYAVPHMRFGTFSEDLAKYRNTVALLGFNPDTFYSWFYRLSNPVSYMQAQSLREIVKLLIENDASPNPPPGPFGSTLTLASFIGVREVFDILIKSGASYVIGGILRSPLNAAADRNLTDFVEDLLELKKAKNEAQDMETDALCTACEKDNVSIVESLLRHGVGCYAENENGTTPLSVCLARLAGVQFHNIFSRETEVIVQMLLDAHPSPLISDSELAAVAKIRDQERRTRILQKMQDLILRRELAYLDDFWTRNV